MRHIVGFDYLRGIAAFSVVWIHSCHTNPIMSKLNEVNSYAVPAFILISIFLLGPKIDANMRSLDVSKKFLLRILPQYIFWTILYLSLRFLKLKLSNEPFDISFSTIFLGGSSIQLWFLPAIAIWYLLMSFIYKYKNIWIDLSLAVVLFILGRCLMKNNYLEDGFQNCFALYSGYIFMAKIIYQNFELLKKVPPIIYALITILCLGISIIFDLYIINIIYAISILLFFATLGMKSNKIANVMSRYSFGIYLSHFLFIQIILVVENSMRFNNSTLIVTLLNIVMTFLFSTFLCYLLDKNNYTKKLI